MKCIVFIVFYFIFPCLALALDSGTENTASVTGFECANDVRQLLPLLGRGTEFPNFVVMDVSRELARQHPKSVLRSVRCSGPAQAEFNLAGTADETGNKPLQGLMIAFPLQLEVDNGSQIMTFSVGHSYQVFGLDTPGIPKVVQNFVVDKRSVVVQQK